MHFASVIMVFATLAQTPEPTGPSLKTQLESYFRIPKASDRAKAVADIIENHRFQEVAAELPRLEFWNRPEHPQEWSVGLPSGSIAYLSARLPADHDMSKLIPLVLAFHREGSISGNTVSDLMYNSRIQHAWVAVGTPVGGSFRLSTLAAGDLPALLRDIRRRIHTDTDRTYIIGEQDGADAAWMAAIMYPNHFAGGIAISGFPRVPYPEQAYALLLPNLRGTPVLSVWTDGVSGESPSAVAAVNKAISNFAHAAGLPFEAATLAPSQIGVMPFPQREIAEVVSKVRHPQASVQLWFRYLPQGNAGWLRATEIAGDVWDDEQISIAVTASADRDEFITETIKQKLFYIGGHIDGQTITVDTKRVASIELRLSPEQVDFSQPVTAFINGRKRFEGVLEPSIKDLLESAYEDWDFQHPAHFRKTFSIHAPP